MLVMPLLMSATSANAALALDRTRVIFDGGNKSVSLTVENKNSELPYLAQSWIEDTNGKKVTSPLAALPPVQRIEANEKSQIKIQDTGAKKNLPQDRESLFYFNVREIPPKSEKPNTLQIALQTRIKLFYRPESLRVEPRTKPWQELVTLTKSGDEYIVHNPTPYYVVLSAASASVNGKDIEKFEPVMIEPNGQEKLNVSVSILGSKPVITYINDYGGRPRMIFSCNGSECKVSETKEG